MRICVTLTDESMASALGRMAELRDVADLFEVRADHVRDFDLEALLRARTKPILLTCRSESEGGRSPAADAPRRRRLLAEAFRLGFDFVDVEASSGFDEIAAERKGRGLVLSVHDFERTPEDLDGIFERMAARRPEIVKIVTRARSIADLGRVLAFARRRAKARQPGDPALVTFAMGPEAVASRILGGRYGAPFTFAAPANGLEAAPGQLPARTLAEVYRAREVGPATKVYGVLGVDVLRSLSPAIHNRAFKELGLDAVYVPLQAESFEAFRRALPDLDLSGFSVTRPYKQDVLALLEECEPQARRTASVNTVAVREGRLLGCSTDGDGVLGPLRRRTDVSGRRVALIGAGGAARAAAFALKSAGAVVTVLGRRSEQAAEVAAATGAEHAPLGALASLDWDVLLNATPVGSGAVPGQSPVPAGSLRPNAIVFDMVYEPLETPLLAAARAKGCETIDGLEMLVAQAAGQLSFWTGREAPLEAMAAAALAALADAAGAGRRTMGAGVVEARR